MSKTVDFYFDYGSPTTYLAARVLPKIAERTGATINYKPALLGGIFKEVGNRAPATIPQKGRWMFDDISRFAERRYHIPFKMNPHFPVNTIHIMRGALVALRDGYLDKYSDAMWQAMWVDGRDMSNPQEIAAVVRTIGLEPQPFSEAIQDPAIKQELFERTAEAVARGCFGMPTFFVNGEMHFGQDRLDWVEEALKG